MTDRTRGRRPAGSGTREAIEEAARRQFAERGYRDTTLRSVAVAAGVDARLVLHYFGSKRQLFVQTVELPLDPELVLARLSGADGHEMGPRAAEVVLAVLDDPNARRALVALVRAAVSEPEAAEAIRDVLTERLLTPLARQVGGDQPELRASLMASQMVGLAMARHIVAIEPLAAATRDQLVRALGPAFTHYLVGDWVGQRPISDPSGPTIPDHRRGGEPRRQQRVG
jgi:AcrR family transcriptional regulator